MKRLVRNTGFKITTAVLLIITLCCTLAGAVGIIVCADGGFYDNTKDQILKNSFYSLTTENCYKVMDSYLYDYYNDLRDNENQNFRYQIYSYEDEKVVESTYNSEYSDMGYYVSAELHYYYDPFSENLYYTDYWYDADKAPRYTITGYVLEDLEYKDEYQLRKDWIDFIYDFRFIVIAVTIISFLLSLVLTALLMAGAGRRNADDEVHLSFLDRIPYDLILAALFIFLVYEIYLLDATAAPVVIPLLAFDCILAVPVLLTTAVRLKAGTLLKNTLCWYVLRGIVWLFRKAVYYLQKFIFNLPLLWQVLVGIISISLIEFILILMAVNWIFEPVDLLILWFIEKILLSGFILYITLQLRHLQKGAAQIAAGDLNYQIDTHTLIGPFENHGRDLNNIRLGMQTAVETQLRSERMKTELITNVSHDIKTPLTSIINYVDLLKKEEQPNDTTREYIDVLDRQSARLKKLIEDLVEASKASTGNLAVNLEPCEVSILLSQACAEYEERFRNAGIEPIVTLPEQPTLILADGRHLWRVFDNLLNNICKYALPGTRAYLSLEATANQASVTFRNISKTQLNISAEDLMERFVRGDSSRNTEGSGLGLSIARSLTELQHGTLDLTIDGDLFKVMLQFDMYNLSKDIPNDQ